MSNMVDRQPGPEVIKIFNATQLSMKFKLLIKTKLLKNKDILAYKLSNVVFTIQ